ncbi:hypothetical protein Agabi119p4_6194 [Agaricus bisporus var. burnettii]|uniref:Globin-sensor domain-containing protein n=1 Tax=Agaricus bisporus var. burnettii TaxID=192524 RepID=A0A8H7C831_AGABI|nr:hypothetical protein Agabi119p4_6194 [Agaricus bisporus var. burnettii]
MRTITPESLETLSSRVSYTRDFVNFTADDAAALHAAKPYLGPLVPAVVDAVYVKLFEFTITAQSFVPRQTGFTGDAPVSLDDLNLDHPQIKFRKDFLAGYLVKVVSLDYDNPKSWEYFDKVAIMHTGTEPGFKHRVNKPALRVEYTHLGLLLGFVEDILLTAVLEHAELDLKTKVAVVKAVNKILWLQNDLFARHYINEKKEA